MTRVMTPAEKERQKIRREKFGRLIRLPFRIELGVAFAFLLVALLAFLMR